MSSACRVPSSEVGTRYSGLPHYLPGAPRAHEHHTKVRKPLSRVRARLPEHPNRAREA
jgi:hypothetical protein